MSQPYAQQPPASPQPSGQLLLVLRRPPGLGSGVMNRPSVTIDNYPAPAEWGENAFPVVAGRHLVRASTTYMWTYGQAELPVEIQPGQSLTVHYSAPMITFIGGLMGFELQPRAGALAVWLILGFVGLVLILTIVAAIVSSS